MRKVPDHKGVQLWTEIDSSRAIALHAFSPVDGTPLSDGCVRMNDDMACTIFDGSRVGMLKIEGFARPMCDPAREDLVAPLATAPIVTSVPTAAKLVLDPNTQYS